MTVDPPVIESPQQGTLNYSIISSDEDSENQLVLKLKVSKSSKVPVVLLQRLNTSSYAVSPRTSSINEQTTARTSLDATIGSFIPHKITELVNLPKKRQRHDSLSEEFKSKSDAKDIVFKTGVQQSKLKTECNDFSSKQDEKGHKASPRKLRARSQSICYAEHNDILLERKLRVSSRKSYQAASNHAYSSKMVEALATPSRKRGLIERRENRNASSHTAEKHNQSCKVQNRLRKDNQELGKRLVRTPERFRDVDFEVNPKTNHNKSFRRSILKCRLNLEADQRKSTPRRNARRSTFLEYFLDSEEDVEEKEKQKSLTKGKQAFLAKKRSSNSFSSSEEEDILLQTTTPKSKRKQSTPKTNPKCTPKTPKNRAKLIREGVITPSMHSRASIVPKASTPLMKARSALHVSYVPPSLPCREKEYCDIYNFLEGKLLDGCGGCMYVSGVPGTGKTATVTSVISVLQKKRNIPEFTFVNINGMRLTEPRQSYVEIWKQLTNRTVPWEQAQSFLDDKFTKKSKKEKEAIVMLIDELDILYTKRQDVVYNLLDWPTKAKNQLIIVAIANTMDLPERLLMSRVTSRLGLTRLTFQAYNYKQLQEIVTKRLVGTDSFNPDAIQLVARKVASVSGDARRALDICRRAAELAEQEDKGELVNVTHINEALNIMITQPTVMAIKRCSRLQRLILQAIVAEVERTGVEETTFVDVFKMLVSCCALDGFKMVSSTIAQHSIAQLNSCRLILTDQKCNNIYQRIILNVSVHDVYFALKKSD